MKYALIIIAIALLAFKNSNKDLIYCVHHSPNKDTLYLLENDEAANILYNCWEQDTNWNGNNPTIVFLEKNKFFNIKKF
jgi:hypothetical protein